MMWLSQLAYETDDRAKVDGILKEWQVERRAFVFNDPATRAFKRTACAIVAGGRGATIVSFAGTDPLKINDWITDFNAFPSLADMHTGFAEGLDRVWPQIKPAIENPPANEGKLFFTGHSLGGSLAILAAERATRELKTNVTAVYTFGSPRPGGPTFAAAYPGTLGDNTFRLAHGADLVATLPPSLGILFRHVGCALICKSGGSFDEKTPILPRGNDKPEFATSVLTGLVNAARRLLGGRFFEPVGDGIVGRIVALSPTQIQDHVPIGYFRALGINL
jgi:hypothetical protein